MAVFKCKMCGGTLEIDNKTVATCEYCGTQQTLPKLDDERRANLYDRANHFRRNNEYDKAMDIYEQILNEDKTDAEAYWSLVLCGYGIEYVEDPVSHKRIPTVNRAQFTSVFDNDNYKSALKYADSEQKTVYEAEAEAINEIQKGILAISQKEEPFDVFICYKETDNGGRRTPDSVLANDLYHQLIQEGFKVFFSRITLEDKLGTAYEPYIFAALNSAKVMVVLGTKPEYFNAVWVKNEWSRYLALVKNSNGKKILIPAYKDMDPYDLPTEFSHLQAQDMSKLGFMQDLIRGVKKLAQTDEPKVTVIKETVTAEPVATAAVAPLLRRVSMFLEDGDFVRADEFCEQVLNQEPENAEAYLGKLMAELRVKKREALANCAEPFNTSANYQKVLRFGSPEFKAELEGYIKTINDRNEENRLRQIYNQASVLMNGGISEDQFKSAAAKFKSISGYRDSAELAEECLEKAEAARKDDIIDQGKKKMNENDIDGIESAIKIFESVAGWKDADQCIEKCREKIEEIKVKAEADRIEAERQAELARAQAEKNKEESKKITKIAIAAIAVIVVLAVIINSIAISSNYNKAKKLMEEQQYNAAAAILEALDGYKDSEDRLEECKDAISNLNLIKKYNQAVQLEENGEFRQAIYLFNQVKGFSDVEERMKTLLKQMMTEKTVVSAGYNKHIVKLKEDGTVEIFGECKTGQNYESGWTNIVSVSAKYFHTAGLKSNGSVIATGNNDDGRCNVSGWTDIVSVSAGYKHTIGLKSDGTVVATGSNYDGQCNVSGWKDIVDVSAGCDHTVALKLDGTVDAVGNNKYGQCNVFDWTDMIDVSAGEIHTVGLKSDGTVVAVGENDDKQCNVSEWKDIIAISAGTYHTVGLKSDGTVVAVGENDDKQCNVSDWTDIVSVIAGHEHTLGVKSDGTVLIAGSRY